jgi:transposase-like protein
MKNAKQVLKKRKRDMSIIRFQELFKTEENCHDYLFHLKWPNGFTCSKCGNTKYYFVKRLKLYQCTYCHKQHSVTSETLLHKSHLPLVKWFWAIYLVSRDKRGCSALSLKNMLQISYPSAWLLLQKLRTAMAEKEQDYILAGLVVLDDAFFGGASKEAKRGRGTNKSKVLVAISLNKDNSPRFAKMEVVNDLKSKTISPIVEEMILKGSLIRSDSFKSLSYLSGYEHDVIVAGHSKQKARTVFKWANVLISNAKALILGTYHGLPDKHLGKYLKEYCYRFNRRYCEHIIFGKLVNACVLAKPITYAELTL